MIGKSHLTKYQHKPRRFKCILFKVIGEIPSLWGWEGKGCLAFSLFTLVSSSLFNYLIWILFVHMTLDKNKLHVYVTFITHLASRVLRVTKYFGYVSKNRKCSFLMGWKNNLSILFYLQFSDGNLSDITRAGSLHMFLIDLHKQFGPIASFWMGEQLVVSIASPELFKQQMSVFDRPGQLHVLTFSTGSLV